MSLPDFLPGRLLLVRGLPRDYASFEPFHYKRGRPATWADVWLVRYETDAHAPRNVAIGVLSYPTAVSRGRQQFFSQHGWSYARQVRFANRHLRTISRVVVHPQFRALGLSSLLVRKLIEVCPTRYIEATAMMGRAHPFFARAGMQVIAPTSDELPVYYIFDRQPQSQEIRSCLANETRIC
jgi:ABC-type ATPase with predicted acetyltransferase domain